MESKDETSEQGSVSGPDEPKTVRIDRSELELAQPDSEKSGEGKLAYRAREQWKSKLEFVLSCVSFCVGLGNVWRFPYLCFKNGGGTFFIPYLICLFLGGIPVYFLEVSMGQYSASGAVSVWRHICPLFKGIGYGMITINFISNTYYIIVLAWALLYLTYSFHWELPWATCDNPWNTPNCWANSSSNQTNQTVDSVVEFWEREILQVSDGIDQPNGLQWWLVATLLFMWLVCGFSIWRGIKSTGKAVYVTAIFPYFILFVLFVRGVTLPGAADGISYYLKPDFSRLTESGVWIDAGTQIFFSYCLAQGSMIALGSYNRYHNNFYHQLFLVCLLNSGTSIFAGFAIFSVIGFMSHQQNVSIADVAKEGQALPCPFSILPTAVRLPIGIAAFIAYPKGVVEMPWAPVWAVCFFVMILLLGAGSQFVSMEGFVTAVVDMFPQYLRYGKRREWFIFGTCTLSFLVGLTMVTRGGVFVFQLFDYYGSSGICLLWICFFEAVVVAWLYGARRFEANIADMLGFRIFAGFRICWRYLTPLVTFCIFAFSVYKYQPVKYNGNYTYPTWAIAFGICLALCSMLQVPGYVLYRLFVERRPEEAGFSLKRKLQESLKPIEPSR